MKKYILAIFLIQFFLTTIKAQNKNDRLLNATFNNNEKTVFNLLKGGADPNTATFYGVTPLMYATDNGNLYLCKLLLQHNAKVNAQPIDGISPLHAGTASNSPEVLQLLLDKGAKVDIQDTLKRTPLIIACEKGFPRMADMLLYHGADPNIADIENTPLMITAFYGDTLMSEILLNYNANPNLSGNHNNTPLMCAVQENYLPMVKLLIANGADINLRNDQNMSALDIAIFLKHTQIAKYLIKQGAKPTPHISKNISTLKLAKIKRLKEIVKILEPNPKGNLTEGIFSISLTHKIGFPDYLIGLETTFHQDKYNMELSAGWENRPFRKKVLSQSTQNLYTQYREYLSKFKLKLRKNFTIISTSKSNIGLFAGIENALLLSNYKGSTENPKNIKIIPQAGLFLYNEFVGVSIGTEYCKSDYIDASPYSINLSFRIFINKKIRYTVKNMYY